jgi:hypothetical protein
LLICFTSLTIINSYVNSSDVEALDTWKGWQSKDMGWEGYAVGCRVAFALYPASIGFVKHIVCSRTANA